MSKKILFIIGSLHAYLSLNQRQSSGCPITGVQFELFVIGYLSLDTHVMFTSITQAPMAFFTIFSTVFKACATDRFAQKKFSKDIFNSDIVIDTLGYVTDRSFLEP